VESKIERTKTSQQDGVERDKMLKKGRKKTQTKNTTGSENIKGVELINLIQDNKEKLKRTRSKFTS
jgi:hypothetical protein